VGIDDRQSGIFLGQIFHQRDKRCVLEHIGVIAGVKGVAVTKHARILVATDTIF
jgi:hypothetical protein